VAIVTQLTRAIRNILEIAFLDSAILEPNRSSPRFPAQQPDMKASLLKPNVQAHPLLTQAAVRSVVIALNQTSTFSH